MAGSYCTWIRAAGSLAIAIDGGDTTAVSLQRYCCQAFPNSLHSAVEQPCDCWSRAKDTIRPTIIVPENNTGFFNTLAGFFSRGRKKTSLAPSMSYWSIFERDPVGLDDFACSKFQRMANWPKQGELHETGRLFRILLPGSIFRSKLGQLAIRWNSSRQNRPISLQVDWWDWPILHARLL